MAHNRNLTATEFRGKRCGNDFDDLQFILDGSNGAISRLEIRHGGCLDAITVGIYLTSRVHFVLISEEQGALCRSELLQDAWRQGWGKF